MKLYAKTQKIKSLMLLNGLASNSLSKNLSISLTHTSNIINGKRSPSPKLAKNMADTLGVGIEDIFKITDKEVS